MQCVSLQIDVFINKPVSHIICIWFVTSSDAVCMRLIQLIPNRPQTNFSMQTCNACSTLCCCENSAKYAMLVSDADQLLIVFQIIWESSLYLKCIIISYQYCSSYIVLLSNLSIYCQIQRTLKLIISAKLTLIFYIWNDPRR